MKSEFRKSFAKDLKNISDKSLLKKVAETIEEIEKAETLREIANIKKLKIGENYFRVRIGDFRLGLAVEKDTVIFVRFLNRKDIYKNFP